MADKIPDSSETVTTSTTKVELHGPGNWGAKISGVGVQSILVTIIILLVSAALGYQSWENNVQSEKREEAAQKLYTSFHLITHGLLKDVAIAQTEANKIAAEGQKKVERAIFVQTYVTSRDDKEKKALNLQMPDELRWNASQRNR